MISALVLDDRESERELLATVLSHAGYEVGQASSGAEGLAMARDERPDVIVADILMPEMNGYEFVQELRADPVLAPTPVVFCTATYGVEEVRRRAEACGVSHILIKPCGPQEILRVVDDVLGSSAGPGLPIDVSLDREHLRVVNDKLLQKIRELEEVNEEQQRLHEELRRAERDTTEALTLLETLQSTAPVGFGFIDREYRIRRLNSTLAGVTGVPAEAQLGKRVPDTLPELWPHIEPHYRHVLETGEAIVNQETRAGDSGDAATWLASYYPVRVGGQIIGIGVVVIDVTERTHAEELRSAVMDTMVEGIYVVDAEGRLVLMNSAASKMLGWTEDDLRGTLVRDTLGAPANGAVIPDTDSTLLDVHSEVRSGRSLEHTFTTKNGGVLPVAYSAAPLGSGDNVRGAVVVFRDISDEKAAQERAQNDLNTLSWVGRIRDALDEERFVLHSQPILPLKQGLPPREELLLRMIGRDKQVIPPGQFLPSAEKYGLIGEIDRWVVTKAIRLAAAGRRVNANLSAASVGSGDLLPLIETELETTGADPGNVVFELTETALMHDVNQGQAFARRLVDLGCRVAIDDFGTGFGSFTYLKSLPIEYLKIDVDFVRELSVSQADRQLVEAIVGLAAGFGQQTIAEGVEDQETLELLREYGVDFAQGYHIGRPGPLCLNVRTLSDHDASSGWGM